MNESQHLSSQFDEELSRLRTHVLQMGGLVETQVSAAIEAYSTGEVGQRQDHCRDRPQGQ
jgi:phosphate transport system protein